MITYRLMCIVLAGVFVALGAILLISPLSYIALYSVASGEGVGFLGRRAAPAFLGLALLYWVLRDEEPGATRSALCGITVFVFVFIAALGIFEFLQGAASASVLGAAAGELLLAVLMWRARKS